MQIIIFKIATSTNLFITPEPKKGVRLLSCKDRIADKNAVWQKMSKKEVIVVEWIVLKNPKGKLKPKLIASNEFEIVTPVIYQKQTPTFSGVLSVVRLELLQIEQ